jgi:two-component system chemotaxis family response regulator WspR
MGSPVPHAPVVLLVDDARTTAAALRALLCDESDIGFHYCGRPEEAVEAAIRLQPTVILLDVVMPGIDGLTLLRHYRAEPATRQVPIVMLSTAEDAQIKADAFALGANDYLVKLPATVELVARLRYHSQAYANLRRLDELNQALQALSLEDGLTGIANRRCFDELLEKEWRRGVRERGTLSLLLLDVDYFKRYNDRYGHPAGDACLRAIATVLKDALRRPSDLAARYGGEEFAGLLPGTPAEGAIARAEDVRTRVEALRLIHQGSLVSPDVTVSIGVASLVPGPSGGASRLVAAADKALYQAKRAGRNCVRHAMEAIAGEG